MSSINHENDQRQAVYRRHRQPDQNQAVKLVRRSKMDRLEEVKDTVEVFEDTKIVILHWPNTSREYDLSQHQSEFYKLMSVIMHENDVKTGFIHLSAETLKREAGLSGITSVDINERARAEELKSLQQFKDHYVGMWATDRPDLFEDHLNYDLLSEIKG